MPYPHNRGLGDVDMVSLEFENCGKSRESWWGSTVETSTAKFCNGIHHVENHLERLTSHFTEHVENIVVDVCNTYHSVESSKRAIRGSMQYRYKK